MKLAVGEDVFHRTTSLLALRVEEGERSSGFLEAGRVAATFETQLVLDGRTKITFAFRGRGRIKLEVGGKVLGEGEAEDLSTITCKARRIRSGATDLKLDYEAPESGPAHVMLYWSSSDFPFPEPVPARVLKYPSTTVEEAVQDELRTAGRELFLNLRCHGCHNKGNDNPAAEGFQPLAGPSLAGIGQRLDPAWLAAWIASPRELRPTARMPHLIKGATESEIHEKATSIVRFLLGDGFEPPAPEVHSPEDAAAGGALFSDLGCVACHLLPARNEAEPGDDRIPLREASRKFTGGLIDFLKNPSAHHPGVRMPDFGLTDQEATQLAALIRFQGAAMPFPPLEGGSVEAGKKLVQELRCASCHDGIGEAQQPIPMESEGPGCLDLHVPEASPDYGLPTEDRSALRAFIASGDADRWWRFSAAERAELEVRNLRCTACHKFEHQSDRWTLLSTETAPFHLPKEGELEQTRPDLTWVGMKLHTDWMRAFIVQAPRRKLRPWLRARMPGFPARAEVLAKGLAERQGIACGSSQPEVITEQNRDLVKTGAYLIDKSGFGCTACHGLQGREAYAVFEVGALEFDAIFPRLRREFFDWWMWNPRRVDQASRMPTYVDEEGITQQDEILDGEGLRQFHAMWLFLSECSEQRK